MVNRRALNRKAVSLIPSAADMTQVYGLKTQKPFRPVVSFFFLY